MKFNSQDLAKLRARVDQFVQVATPAKIHAHAKTISDEGKALNLVARVRWDIYWGANRLERIASTDGRGFDWGRDCLDSHIDTAMRSILRDILPEYSGA